METLASKHLTRLFCLCNEHEKTKHTLEKNVYLVNEHINVPINSFTIRIIATVICRVDITQEFIIISVSEPFSVLFCFFFQIRIFLLEAHVTLLVLEVFCLTFHKGNKDSSNT